METEAASAGAPLPGLDPTLPPTALAEATPEPPRAGLLGGLAGASGLGGALDAVGETLAGPRPFAAVSASLPPGRLLRVADQLVHVEQAGSGEPVVLVHGFGCSSHSWRLVTPALTRHHRVIAPDLSGFGWTQRPSDPAAYTLEGQEALLLGVAERLGLERFHLVGHSYGGGLALWLASRHPARVRSLTLVAAAPPEHSVQQRQTWARFRSLNWLLVHFFVMSRSAVRRALELCYHDPAMVTDEAIEAYRSRLLVEGVEDAYYGLMAPLDLPAPEVDLERLQVPTLVIWGEHDKLIPFEQARPLLQRLPRAQIAVLGECGHAPMEECPHQMLAHLLPFLERHRERWPERLRDLLRQLSGGRGQAPPLHQKSREPTAPATAAPA